MLWQLANVSLAPNRLRDVTVAIHPGITAVVGHSGAGKTSLLNLLVDFEKPDHGTIQHTLPVFWSPQDAGLWPHLTVREHIAAVGGAADVLAVFDLTERADCRPAVLSQGECSRLAVARAWFALTNRRDASGSMMFMAARKG